MKRFILIVGAMTMWIALSTSCLWACVILDLKNQPRYEYKYIDAKGNLGTSKDCFIRDSVNVCVVGKHTRRVLKTEKYEVLRSE